MSGPRNSRWEAITAAGTFAFGGGLVSLLLVGMAALLAGSDFSWPAVSGFVTICIVAMVVGAPILLIDRARHRQASKAED